MQVLGLHHVSINVSDVAAARSFYCDVLGLEERTDRPEFSFDGAWLDAGGQQIHLIDAEVPADLGQHLALEVEDLDGVVAELRQRGIEVTDPRPVARNRQAFLTDPSGNVVELQELSPA